MRTSLCCIFFAAISVSLAQDSGPQLEILPMGSEIRRNLGANGFFTCRANPQNEQSVTDVVWVDPRGEEVPDERHNRVSSAATSSGTGRELFFTNITENDSGSYVCRARSADGQEITKSFSLLVYMSIRWEDAPQQQHPVAGSRATIKCLVKANPPAIVEWFDSNGDFIRKTDRYTPLDTGLMHIENVSSEDDGNFLCRAKVPAEGEMSELRITVETYSRPEITVPVAGSDVEIVESQEGSIRCQASGKPEPVRTWLNPAGTDASLVDGLTVDGDGTLTFRPASREMAGQYRCSATNDVDAVEIAVNVVVIVKPEIDRYKNVTSTEAGSTTLECRVSGSPPPTIAFQKTGTDAVFEKDVILADDRVLVQVFEEGDQQVGVMTIRDVTRADAGLYECVASNPGGVAKAPGMLTVQYAPLLTGPDAVYTWNGHAANLSCRAAAEPAAQVSWTLAGGRRAEDEPQMQQARHGDISVLTVTPTDDSFYNVYTCSASNSQGSRTLDITLREATAPGLVTGATAQDVTATSVEFSLPAPDSATGLPVHTYLVQYVMQGQPWDVSRDHMWTVEQPFVLEDLTPEQTYLFRFAAENDVGVGDWSAELRQMMPKIDVPQSPMLITASGLPVAEETGPEVVISSGQSDSYEARWDAGADNGAEVDNYQVSFYKVISNKNVWRVVSSTKRTSVVEAPGPLTFRLTDLKSDSFYRLEVRAHNRIGYSEPTQVIIQTAAGVVQEPEPVQPARDSSLLVGVVIAVLLAVVVLCDLTCYAVNKRGITHMLCSRARGSSGSAKLTEEAASEKEPLQVNGNGNKSSPPPTEPNGERDTGDLSEELNIDKAQLDAAKDSPV